MQSRTPRSPRVLSLDDVVPNPVCFNFSTQFIRMFDAVRVLFRISWPSDPYYHVNERASWYHAYSVFPYQAQGLSSSSACLDQDDLRNRN
jgi:hypothetical protein